MSLSAEDRETLVRLYVEKAKATWDELEIAVESEKWSMAANRMYYSLFHAVSALLVKDQHEVSSHLGAKINFGKYYVQEGIVTHEEGRLYAQLESLRERADYDCFYCTSEEDIRRFLPEAQRLFAHVINLVSE